MSEVTRLLEAAAAGSTQAAAELLPAVYGELRVLAAARLADERQGHTLEPTALVHEAYLRLVGGNPDQPWAGRGHFFAAAAEAMRRILIDHARKKGARKRAGQRVDFDPELFAAPDRPEDLLALDETLGQLEQEEPQIAALVKLRYFGGMTIPAAAEALGVSPRTADAWWAFARAWLLAKLSGESV
ncbi:MAG TPA: ECF-type sigma factor [Gemmataceae bacterium]|jgi:RNA polymerase sigma factor (TIGR02999 family)|nr:ECF-type sigma factor [Gemmataceae bacterium]